MDFPKFLDLGAELETEISKLYEGLAGLSTDSALTKRLRSLANEEINHANTLLTGKTYYQEMPDLFSGITMNEEDVRAAIAKAKTMRASLAAGQSLLDWLKRMLELEKAFERIHLAASVKISEPSLHQLFASLANGDQSHIAALGEMIGSLS